MRRAVEVRTAFAWGFALFGAVALLASLVLTVWLLAGTTTKINAERERNIRAACQDQNTRHDATIHKLDVLIARLPPGRKSRAVEGRDGTVLLIDALAPKRKCADLVKKSIGGD